MIVMCICHFDETNASGGLEKQARLLSKSLRDKGKDVVVLASTRSWRKQGWCVEEDLPVRYFWCYASPQVSGRYLPASLMWGLQVLIWSVMNRRKIEVFHCHQIRIHAFVGALLKRIFGIPHISKSATGGAGVDIRAIGTRKYFGKTGRKFVVRNTTTFIATTKSIETDLMEYGVREQQIRVIPNGLVFKPIQPSSNENRHKRFLFLGRLSQDKNVLNLIRSALLINDEDFRLDIFGRGDLEDEVRRLLSSSNKVIYRGFVEDPSALLSSYGYLVLPSSAEGLSNAMLEAMTAGVVPVATRVSGCVDHIVPGVTGYFMDGVDEISIKQAVTSCLNVTSQHWQTMSENVTAYSRSRFSIESVTDEYLNLYSDLVETAK
jgi:glycosyltransferase involved in cell wall biosynthesis